MQKVSYSLTRRDFTKMKYTWFTVYGDQVITKSPSLIGCVVVTPNGDSETTNVTLYDGESDNDPKIITIRSGVGVTRAVRFQPCLQTQRGLYFKAGAHFGEALIQVQWESE